MDLNYDIHTWDFTLKTATLTKITQNVVEAALRIHPHHPRDNVVIVSSAREIAEKLDLLPGMIAEIKKIIPPILVVLQNWYESSGYEISPILTPHGTVDVAKSARALMRSNFLDLPARRKFEAACVHCLEEEIFHFGKLLSKEDKLTYKKAHQVHHIWTIQGFWYSIYKGNFSTMLTLNDLSPANIKDGMNRAMYWQRILVIKYFLKKAPLKMVQNIVTKWMNGFLSTTFIAYLSPDTLVTLFRIDQRDFLESMFSAAVLKTLLQWPYQHLFLKAAKTLALKMSLKHFWEVACDIISQPVIIYEDYNYKELFVGFWKMRLDYVGAYAYCSSVNLLLQNVFLMRDKHIAFMVFDDISKRNKEGYLHRFNSFCVHLILSADYKTLRFIMEVCKVKDERLYLSFKTFAEKYCSGIILCPVSPELRMANFSTMDLKNNLQLFKKLMSEWESS